MPPSCWAISIPASSPAAALEAASPHEAVEAIERVVAQPAGPHGRAGGARHPSHRSTRRWPKASAWCRSARAIDPRTLSRWCRWAARGGCTPRRWPRARHRAASSCRACPACCRRPACWPRPIEHEVTAEFATPVDGARPGGAARGPSTRSIARGRADGRREGEPSPMSRSATSPTSATSASRTTWRFRFELDDADPASRLYRDFLEAHDRIYGHSVESPARIVGVRTVHRVGGGEIRDEMQLAAIRRAGARSAGATSWWPAAAALRRAPPSTTATRCRRRFAFAGPAIVQQTDTTTLVEPGWSCVVDRAGNLILTVDPPLRGFREGEVLRGGGGVMTPTGVHDPSVASVTNRDSLPNSSGTRHQERRHDQGKRARSDHRRGGAPQARGHRQRDAADAAALLLLADRQGGARCLVEPVHDPTARRWRRRRRFPIHLATLIPVVAKYPRRLSARVDEAGRRLLHERSLSRRHAPSRHRRSSSRSSSTAGRSRSRPP